MKLIDVLNKNEKLDLNDLPKGTLKYTGFGLRETEQYLILKEPNSDEIYGLYRKETDNKTILWVEQYLDCGTMVLCKCSNEAGGRGEFEAVRRYSKEEFMVFMNSYCEYVEFVEERVRDMEAIGIL